MILAYPDSSSNMSMVLLAFVREVGEIAAPRRAMWVGTTRQGSEVESRCSPRNTGSEIEKIWDLSQQWPAIELSNKVWLKSNIDVVETQVGKRSCCVGKVMSPKNDLPNREQRLLSVHVPVPGPGEYLNSNEGPLVSYSIQSGLRTQYLSVSRKRNAVQCSTLTLTRIITNAMFLAQSQVQLGSRKFDPKQ